MWMSRLTPAAVMAATTARVPSVLTRRRSAPPWKSRGMATRCTTASTPARAGPSVSGRVTSPTRVSTAGRRAGGQPGEDQLAVGRRPDQRDDPMIRGQQRRDHVAADEAGRAGHEDGGHGVGFLACGSIGSRRPRNRSIDAMDDPQTPPAGSPPLAAPALRRLIQAMPKAELHLHLDGSLRVDTALDLARTRGIDAPRDWAGMSAALIAPMPCRDQAELLARVRPADRPDAGRRGARADHRRAGRDEGRRRGPLRRDPLGTAAARRGRAVARRRDRGRVRRGRGRGATGPAPSCDSSAPRCARTTPRRTSPWRRPRRASATPG